MCERLSDLHRGLRALVEGFDPARLIAAEALVALEDFSAMEKLCAAGKALAAVRVEETNALSGSGTDVEEHLAKVSGTSKRSAREALSAGRLGAREGAAAGALRRGELSTAQAALVGQGAEADPAAEEQLVEQARTGSLQELKDEAARTRAAADPDPEATRRRVFERRGLRTWGEPDGSRHLHWWDTAERVAEVEGVLRASKDRIFREARKEGRRQPHQAHLADALHQAVSGEGTGGGVTKKIIIASGLEPLQRGYLLPGERCEVSGVGPVSPGWVRQLVAEREAFVALVLTEGEEVRNVLHLGRRPTAHQVSALEWLYPTCSVTGCSAARVQWDHRVDWKETKHTVLDELDGLCQRHHQLKTTKGWRLVEGTGKRDFVPPGDPRHPGELRRQSAGTADNRSPPLDGTG